LSATGGADEINEGENCFGNEVKLFLFLFAVQSFRFPRKKRFKKYFFLDLFMFWGGLDVTEGEGEEIKCLID
jgi:hypothetical protein